MTNIRIYAYNKIKGGVCHEFAGNTHQAKYDSQGTGTVLGCSAEELLVPDDFPGAPLLPGNTVDVATIQSQRFYCDKYQTAGRWICSGGKVATVFYYDGKQYCLPFRAIFKPDMLYWLMESAKLQMEDKIESIALDDEWEEW